jgi:hypothetical protein
MVIGSVIFFFVMTWGLGYGITFFISDTVSSLERQIMRIGIGIGVFGVVSAFFNIIGIPIDWKWFLLLALIFPLYSLGFNVAQKKVKWPSFDFTLKKSTLATAFVLIIFSFSLFMYVNGAFSYPYLENDDPWGQAESAKYVSIEKDFDVPLKTDRGLRFFGYLDPYPPTYAGLMGVLHQTNDSLSWTLKFFNALIISLSLLFFFFFVRHLTRDWWIAVFSTFILASIPAYMSHFIWAHTLIVMLFFPFMYCLERIKDDKRWWIPAGVVLGGLLMTQPDQPFVLGALAFFYFVIKNLSEGKINWHIIKASIFGFFLSLLWWITNWKDMFSIKVGKTEAALQAATQASFLSSVGNFFKNFTRIFPPDSGSATRVYTFDDFFMAKAQNMINNPVGIGWVVYLLLFFSFIALLLWFVRLTKEGHFKKGYLYCLYLFEGISTLGILLLTLRYLFIPFGASLFNSLFIDFIVFFALSVVGLLLLFKKLIPKTHVGYLVALVWATYTFLFINSLTFDLPIGFRAFRMWMILPISLGIIVSYGVSYWLSFVKNKKVVVGLVVVLLLGVFLTSWVPKYQLNNAQWPPGGAWFSRDGNVQDQNELVEKQIRGYVWMKEMLPGNTKVFDYAGRDQNVIGFDMFSCKWCPELREFRDTLLDRSPEEMHTWLKDNDYEYVLINTHFVQKYFAQYTSYDQNETEAQFPTHVNNMVQSGLFEPVHHQLSPNNDNITVFLLLRVT